MPTKAINPRFLLAMARLAMAKAAAEPRERRRQGVETFRKLNRDVTVQSRMQLDDDVLARLGQRVAAASRSRKRGGDAPGLRLLYRLQSAENAAHRIARARHHGCARRSYEVMGGPTHCCGVGQLRTGDTAVSANMAENTMNKLARSGQVLSWCASCQVQFTEVMLPAYERQTGRRPFEMTPFMLFLGEQIDDLRPMLREPVPMRVALHRHPGIPGVVEAAIKLLGAPCRALNWSTSDSLPSA